MTSSLNELVQKIAKKSAKLIELVGEAFQKEELKWSFFSIIMYKGPTTIMKGCTKVKPQEWRYDVKLVRHVEGRKEEKGKEI